MSSTLSCSSTSNGGRSRTSWPTRARTARTPDPGWRRALDAAEGYAPANPARRLYLRGPVTTHVAPATTRDAWLYIYNPAVGGAPGRAARIDEGDWRAHVAARGAVPR